MHTFVGLTAYCTVLVPHSIHPRKLTSILQHRFRVQFASLNSAKHTFKKLLTDSEGIMEHEDDIVAPQASCSVSTVSLSPLDCCTAKTCCACRSAEALVTFQCICLLHTQHQTAQEHANFIALTSVRCPGVSAAS